MTTLQQIHAALDSVNATGVRVLFACESGSRAWGFPSADSDFDVRFLYVRPVTDYLRVSAVRDTIEQPITDVLDVCGWDLQKALGLFAKSNPPLMEWLGSPIIYREEGTAAQRLRSLAARFYQPLSCSYHYLQMARNNFREFLQGPLVKAKKYFYVLRPLLAIRWIERGLGVIPTEFEHLVQAILPLGELSRSIADLIERKRSGAELDAQPRIEPISQFIEAEIAHWEKHHSQFPRPTSEDTATDRWRELDDLLLQVLRETWGNTF